MKILLVDNSWTVRDRMGSLIAAIPHATLVAQAGSDVVARRHLADHRPELVIIDPCLSAGNGLALISQIRALQPSTIIVVMTNQVYPEYEARCRSLGADYYYDKSKQTVAFAALLTGLCHARADAPTTCRMCSHGH